MYFMTFHHCFCDYIWTFSCYEFVFFMSLSLSLPLLSRHLVQLKWLMVTLDLSAEISDISHPSPELEMYWSFPARLLNVRCFALHTCDTSCWGHRTTRRHIPLIVTHRGRKSHVWDFPVCRWIPAIPEPRYRLRCLVIRGIFVLLSPIVRSPQKELRAASSVSYSCIITSVYGGDIT